MDFPPSDLGIFVPLLPTTGKVVGGIRDSGADLLPAIHSTWEGRMSRHLADHRGQTGGGRLKHYYRIEKTGHGEGSHATSRSLHKRPLARDGAGRLGHYLRIERGITA